MHIPGHPGPRHPGVPVAAPELPLEKWAALEANDRSFTCALCVVSSLFRLARMDHEATRLTATTRTPGLLTDAETPLETQPAPVDGDPKA